MSSMTPVQGEAFFQEWGDTVLVVEDDSQVRRMICRLLQKDRYHVVEAASGADAVKFCAPPENEVDQVITDIVMPGISGFELIRTLQETRPDIQSLFMSGYVEHSMFNIRDLEAAPAVLMKPFLPRILLKMVADALQRPQRAGLAT